MNKKVKKEIEFILNNEKIRVEVNPFRRVADFLRYDLGLTGTKIGCGEGECGACTILMNGRNVNSCLLMMGQIENCKITTIEYVENLKKGKDLQDAFVKHGAIQCGYCTPGMVMSSLALLNTTPKPDREEILVGISGNLCRCTGYQKIVDAITEVAEKS